MKSWTFRGLFEGVAVSSRWVKCALLCITASVVSCGDPDITQIQEGNGPTPARPAPPAPIAADPEKPPPPAGALDASVPPEPPPMGHPSVPTDAGTSSGLLDAGAGIEPVCEPGALECHGSLIARCNARQSAFELVRDCRDAERCADAVARCALGACPEEELGCSLPELLPEWEGVHGVGLGRQFTCAVITRGAVRCWGRNHHAQLGHGPIAEIGRLEPPASLGNVDVGGPVSQIVAGVGHTCALLTSGEVGCWGHSSARLGYGDTDRRRLLAERNGLTPDLGDDESPASAGHVELGGPVIQLAAGDHFTCALLSSGDVRCWGSGNNGVLGRANTANIGQDETPVSRPPVDLGGPAAFIAAGGDHSCAILRTGEVRCWGRGAGGRLGYGNGETIGDTEAPASAGSVALHERAVRLSASESHTCAVLSSGALQCWGAGRSWPLGYDDQEDIGDDELPTARPVLDLGARVTQVAVGNEYTCALLEGGAVHCWGEASSGLLGAGRKIGNRSLSVTAPRVELGADVVQIEANHQHTCAVLANRELICWGFGKYGNLGYDNTDDVGNDEIPASVGVVPVLRIPPGPVVPQNSDPAPDAGASPPHPDPPAPDAGVALPDPDPPAADAGLPPSSACESGVLRCEGSRIVRCNAEGSAFEFASECPDAALCVEAIASCELRSCTLEELGCPAADPVPDSRVESVALGDEHTCVLTVSGTVRCWGDNEFGQLGYAHTRDIGLDEMAGAAPEVNVGGRVRQIVAGARHTCALLETGDVRCWGEGDRGQLGLNGEANVGDNEHPVDVPTIDLGGPVRQLAAGGGRFTCALLLNGDVRCWGSGSTGQLGLGDIITTANRNIGDNETPASVGPVDVGGPVAHLVSGQSHSCALSEAGDVRCWGSASGGRLGYGNRSGDIGDHETPASAGVVQLAGSAVDLALSNTHSCAVLSDGAVRCWGSNLSSALGYTAPAPFKSGLGDDETPDTVPALNLGQPALRVAVGQASSCALLADGAVRCWGENSRGQAGNATTEGTVPLSSALPQLELGGPARMIGAGEAHICAVLSTRDLVCWGDVSNGKLGYGRGASNQRVGDDETPASMGVVPLF